MAMNTRMTRQMLDQLTDRFGVARFAAGGGNAAAVEAFEMARGYLSGYLDAADKINANRDYSDTGRARARLRAAGVDSRKILVAANEIGNASKRVRKARWEAITGGHPNPADLSGAVMRMEARQWLRSLSQTERVAALYSADEPVVLQAALESPVMAGLDKRQVYGVAERKAAETGVSGNVDSDYEVLDAARVAVELARDIMRENLTASGIGEEDVANFLTAAGLSTWGPDNLREWLKKPIVVDDSPIGAKDATAAPNAAEAA